MRSSSSILAIAGCVGVAAAQVTAWGQCGGSGFSGATSCVSGYTCVTVNEWYSQCQPGAAQASSSASSPSTQTSASNQTPTAGAGTAGAFRFLGRVNPSTKELSWPGTGVSFTFTGTSATIGLSSITGTNSVDLIVDGGSPTVISSVTGSSISTPSGLTYGTHTVVLLKRSEAIYGSIFIGTVTTDGTIGSDAVPTRQIEFIGDSITVGYGLDGTNPCTNSAAVEDNPKTYAALASNSLKADYSVIAWSGKGLVRNIATGSVDTSPLMTELYTRYGANDADNSYTFPSTWKPAAVVIALGTNDFSYLGFDSSGTSYNARSPIVASTFTAGLVAFVKSIQTHYPDAHFFLSTSPMLSDYYPTTADAQHTTQLNCMKDAAAQLGAKVHVVDWPTQGSDVGCDYHPNAATHAAQAPVLAAAVSAALGW